VKENAWMAKEDWLEAVVNLRGKETGRISQAGGAPISREKA